MKLPIIRIVSSLAASALVACGSGYGATGPGPQVDPGPPTLQATVDATPGDSFTPGRIQLFQGGTVTFAFGTVGHNVFFDNAPAGAPDDIPGTNSSTNVTRVFTTVGTYTYNCHIHPGMRGTVTVVAPSGG